MDPSYHPFNTWYDLTYYFWKILQNKQYSYKHELTLEQLIKDSLSLQSWGDEYHIMALSLALQRPIYSYGSLIDISESSSLPYKQFRRMYKFEQIPNHFKYIGNANDANNEPILLHYDGSSHYSAVLKTSHDVKPLVPRIQIIDAIIGSEDNEPGMDASFVLVHRWVSSLNKNLNHLKTSKRMKISE